MLPCVMVMATLLVPLQVNILLEFSFTDFSFHVPTCDT